MVEEEKQKNKRRERIREALRSSADQNYADQKYANI